MNAQEREKQSVKEFKSKKEIYNKTVKRMVKSTNIRLIFMMVGNEQQK
jgi:hypothetical protein